MNQSTTDISAKQILDHVWRDSPLSIHEFVPILTALIFLRWADFQEAELEAMAAFDDVGYEPVLPASFHWRSWHQLPPDELSSFLEAELPATLQQLKNHRQNPLATHLHRLVGPLLKLAALPAKNLQHLVCWLADQPFETPADRRQLLDTLDEILKLSYDKRSGEFQTPRHIATLMVALAAPARGESIYDPCFGSAGLLTTAIDYASSHAEQKISPFDPAGLRISGIELNEAAFITGLTRLVLSGNDDPQLEHGNSLERTPPNNPQQEGFDIVLANPPWGWTGRVHDRYGLEHYPIMTKDATGLFIQHALAQLHPNGRAVIAVPNGILFRGGAERKLREWLLKYNTVEAVISLPERAFMPFTAMKSSILLLRRGGSTTQVRMVDAGPFFKQGKGRQPTIITEDQADLLAETINQVNPAASCWDVDIETLAETEFDLTPRRRNESGLSTILEALQPSVQVAKLKECCRIMAGRSVRSADLVEELPRKASSPDQQVLFGEIGKTNKQLGLFEPSEPIPFIRIKDIKKGQVNKGTSWLSSKTVSEVKSEWKLLAGDVLLSKSGTIGKVGIVRNGAIGAVAASGLYVLRPDGTRLDPHYLAAYLDSNDCRSWLKDRASGAVISHLPKRIIEQIPVPLPPLQIQQRVSAAWRKYGVDALAYLAQLLTDGESDPIAEWVEKKLKLLAAGSESMSETVDFAILDQLAVEVRTLRNEVTHTGGKDNVLAPWLLSFAEAMASLIGVNDMPSGPGLLSILQESGFGLISAGDAVKGHLPIEKRARELTKAITSWLRQGIANLINDNQLSFSVPTSSIQAGDRAELDLLVKNSSPLPLREITLVLDPDWGHETIKYLAENSTQTLKIKPWVPEKPPHEILTLFINWTARTLDGRSVKGKREIAFEIVPSVQEAGSNTLDIGASPYVCGDPIRPDRKDVFFGREELLDQIRRQIIQSGNVVLLEGNRRAGKSSILRHLEGVEPVKGWLSIYCSLQGADGSQEGVGVPTAAIFREIAISIAKGMVSLNIEVPLPDGSLLPAGKKLGIPKACRTGISDEHPFSDFRDFVETALDTVAKHNLGILLMLDEFDKLQEGIDSGVTSPQVPENIRFLVQTYPKFSAILTGSRRLKRLREEYWSALFGLGTRFGVTSLSADAARRLVLEPVKGRLAYSSEAVERVLLLTNRQPFLLQSLCNRVFDMAAQRKIRSITLEMVDEAANLLADDNEHFRSLWDYAASDRRRFILGLIHKEADGTEPLNFGLLREMLSSYGIEVDDDTLIADLEFLRELELIDLVDETSGGHYALSIPLMGRWIGQQHDFEVLKNKARMETEDQHG